MDAAEVAGRIGIIDHGRAVAIDTLKDLKPWSARTPSSCLRATMGRRCARCGSDYRATAGPESVTVFTADGEGQVVRFVEAVGGGVELVHEHPSMTSSCISPAGRSAAGWRGAQRDGTGLGAPAMSTTAARVDPVGVDDSGSLLDYWRTAAMVWQHELVRYSRTHTRILTGLIPPRLFLFVLGYVISNLVRVAGGFDFKKSVFSGIVTMSVVGTASFSAISIVWDREFGFLGEMLPPQYMTALRSFIDRQLGQPQRA